MQNLQIIFGSTTTFLAARGLSRYARAGHLTPYCAHWGNCGLPGMLTELGDE